MCQLFWRAAIERLNPDIPDALLSGGIGQSASIRGPSKPAVVRRLVANELWLAAANGEDRDFAFDVRRWSISTREHFTVRRDVGIKGSIVYQERWLAAVDADAE